jgi:transcriptional regulator with XRE-family HTH domain
MEYSVTPDRMPGGEFGPLLRALREQAGLTQEELAERSALSVRAISDLERGRTATPQRKSVSLLAEALRIEGDELERFRRLARRRTGAAAQPTWLARPIAAPPETPAQARLPHLIELIGRFLLSRPTTEHMPRLMELVGGPGPAATALVMEAVSRMQRSFPDGQFYVNADVCDPARLVNRLERVLGLDIRPELDGPGPDRVGRLRSVLSRSNALLVLDNAVDAVPLRHVLTAGGRCAVIVIARRRLAVFDGVWTFDLSAEGADRPPAPLLTG